MHAIPKIESVKPLNDKRLVIRFQTGETRIYDCSQLLALPRFHCLNDPVFFRMVQVDCGGYGIFWNDEIDISEYELWTNGELSANNHNDANFND